MRVSAVLFEAQTITTTTDLWTLLSFWSTCVHSAGCEKVDVFCSNFADYLIRRFLLYLHLPFSCKAGTNRLFHYSRKASVDVAMAIMSPEAAEPFSRLMALNGGLFKSTIRCAGVSISLELLAHANAQERDSTLGRNSDYRTLLKRATQHLLDLSTERIISGECNVKNHTFLSMVIGEVESIEKGQSPQDEIALRARDSLQYCYALLQAQCSSAPQNQPGDRNLVWFDGGMDDLSWDLDIDNFLQLDMV